METPRLYKIESWKDEWTSVFDPVGEDERQAVEIVKQFIKYNLGKDYCKIPLRRYESLIRYDLFQPLVPEYKEVVCWYGAGDIFDDNVTTWISNPPTWQGNAEISESTDGWCMHRLVVDMERMKKEIQRHETKETVKKCLTSIPAQIVGIITDFL